MHVGTHGPQHARVASSHSLFTQLPVTAPQVPDVLHVMEGAPAAVATEPAAQVVLHTLPATTPLQVAGHATAFVALAGRFPEHAATTITRGTLQLLL